MMRFDKFLQQRRKHPYRTLAFDITLLFATRLAVDKRTYLTRDKTSYVGLSVACVLICTEKKTNNNIPTVSRPSVHTFQFR